VKYEKVAAAKKKSAASHRKKGLFEEGAKKLGEGVHF